MSSELNTNAFREEAEDLLSELETALLELEDSPDNQDLIDRVFRAMHTIKGSGAMFGYDDVSAFTHAVENVFEKVRNGEMEVTKDLLDLTLASRDHIKHLLEATDTGGEADLESGNELTTKLKALLPQEAPAPEALAEEEGPPDSLAAEAGEVTYRVRFTPVQDIFASGHNPLGLLEELAEMGTAKIIPHIESVPQLEDLDPESCHVWWDVILTTEASTEAIRDVFIFVEDECELLVQVIDREGGLDSEAEHKKLGEILIDRGDITAEDLQKILEKKKKLGDELVAAGVVSKPAVQSALAEQEAVREVRQKRKAKAPQPAAKPAADAASSIRVAADKLDYLVDLVGELVIVQARITQVVGERKDPLLQTLSEELERLSDELRDSTLGIRMLPIGTTFSKFRRLVRDLSSELGKEIELETRGAETELDKTVIERLNDPMVHLLRNSIDHGIEQPAVREEAGKERSGRILLSAEHSGGEVLIQIIDDGKGLDPEVIKDKAVERGLISPDVEMSDTEIFNLIFLPGFSTAKQVTNVSGRGVGMDVVKKGIDALRGNVNIESELGKGTRIIIKLPLTLAIIDGLQTQVGDEFFVAPLASVIECVELERADQLKDSGREQRIVNLRGDIVPYIRLREFFDVPGESPAIEQIVVVSVADQQIGIVVDHVIGEHQTVIKSLGQVYKDVPGISGATIKGDGSMALILDIPKLVQVAGG